MYCFKELRYFSLIIFICFLICKFLSFILIKASSNELSLSMKYDSLLFILVNFFLMMLFNSWNSLSNQAF